MCVVTRVCVERAGQGQRGQDRVRHSCADAAVWRMHDEGLLCVVLASYKFVPAFFLCHNPCSMPASSCTRCSPRSKPRSCTDYIYELLSLVLLGMSFARARIAVPPVFLHVVTVHVMCLLGLLALYQPIGKVSRTQALAPRPDRIVPKLQSYEAVYISCLCMYGIHDTYCFCTLYFIDIMFWKYLKQICLVKQYRGETENERPDT